MMGLQAAIYGPLSTGLMGGSAYNVLGPAGALVNVLSNLSLAGERPDILPIVALVGGAMGLTVFWIMNHKAFDEVEAQAAVLEGFSIGVAIVIGGGQLNNALGLTKLKCSGPDQTDCLEKHPEFYNQMIETFKFIGHTDMLDFLPFLVMFSTLFFLNMLNPGVDENGNPKAKKPWLVMIGAIGIVYGYLCQNFWPQYQPSLIIDVFPDVVKDKLVSFDYMPSFKTIPTSDIMIGALKVAFVCIFETLISAMIAQRKYP